jgi:hypothetical protein
MLARDPWTIFYNTGPYSIFDPNVISGLRMSGLRKAVDPEHEKAPLNKNRF